MLLSLTRLSQSFFTSTKRPHLTAKRIRNNQYKMSSSSAGNAGPSAMWDDRYSATTGEEEFVYGTEPNDFLKESFPKLNFHSSPKKCLLLADGEGRNGVYMAKQPGWDVTSMDYSQVGLNKAKSLADKNGVNLTTVCADLADYDLGLEQWDMIIAIFCHVPPPIRERLLKSIPLALKSGGGTFLLENYTPGQLQYNTGGPKDAKMMFGSQMLNDAFGEHLEIQHNQEMIREVNEGKLHTGTAAVVQFIGRKK